MGYIFDLRKKIGHAPIIMPSACVLIVNSKGQLLLQKRADNHFWGYPGGALEAGESLEECAVREVLEETGLHCLELSCFAHQSGQEMHYVYPNGDEVYIVETVFLCTKFEGALKCQESETEDLRFFDLEHLPNNISPLNQKAIDKLVQQNKK